MPKKNKILFCTKFFSKKMDELRCATCDKNSSTSISYLRIFLSNFFFVVCRVVNFGWKFYYRFYMKDDTSDVLSLGRQIMIFHLLIFFDQTLSKECRGEGKKTQRKMKWKKEVRLPWRSSQNQTLLQFSDQKLHKQICLLLNDFASQRKNYYYFFFWLKCWPSCIKWPTSIQMDNIFLFVFIQKLFMR